MIIAENKHDLLSSSHLSGPESATATTSATSTSANPSPSTPPAAANTINASNSRRRQFIVALMQRFPFVRQCIKCSAKDFLHVDDVFLKTQQAVLYPFTSALYDLEQGQLSTACRCALSHIFRLYLSPQSHERPNQALWTREEWERFTQQVVDLEQAVGADWNTWKKIVKEQQQQQLSESANDATSLNDHAWNQDVLGNLPDGTTGFTVAGFCAIYDVLVHQNRLDCVWETLRKFGYQDDLQLPPCNFTDEDSSLLQDQQQISISSLDHDEQLFLMQLFEQHASVTIAHTSRESKSNEPSLFRHKALSVQDLCRVFATSDPHLPPWNPVRAATLFQESRIKPHQHLLPRTSRAPVAQVQQGDDEEVMTVPNPSLPEHQEGSTSSTQSQISPTPPVLSTSGISILSASDSIPSLGSAAAASSSTGRIVSGLIPWVSLSQITKPNSTAMNLLEWMGHWHLMVGTHAALTRLELYRLGYVPSWSPMRQSQLSSNSPPSEQPPTRSRQTTTPLESKSSPSLVMSSLIQNTRQVRVLVISEGSNANKNPNRPAMTSQLIQSLCCNGNVASSTSTILVEPEATVADDNSATSKGSTKCWIETSHAHVCLKRNPIPHRLNSSSHQRDLVVHFLFYHVPQELVPLVLDFNEGGEKNCNNDPTTHSFDLVMLPFDDMSSLQQCQEWERRYIKKSMPRVFVLVTRDIMHNSKSAVFHAATRHCVRQELDNQPLLWTTTPRMTAAKTSTGPSIVHASQEQVAFLTVLARCCIRGESGLEGLLLLQSSPYEAQKRRREQWLQTIGLGVVGVVVVLGVGYFSLASSWLKSFFTSSSSTTETTATNVASSAAATGHHSILLAHGEGSTSISSNSASARTRS